MDKAAKDHAEAVQKRQEQEDAERFAPIKNIYEEVRNLPARKRHGHSNFSTETIKGMWEAGFGTRSLRFWDEYSSGDWNLYISKGTFYLRTSLYENPVKTEDVEEAKKWLIEKLAKIVPTEVVK
ncbi:MAG: hypothetical protein FJ351_03770 [Sphingomonadales bacterium]|nr:hypothetical protein [Sphingomonadales bacterium]